MRQLMCYLGFTVEINNSWLKFKAFSETNRIGKLTPPFLPL